MSVQQNIEKLRKGYAAWTVSKGSAVDYWINLLDDNVQWASTVDEANLGMSFAKDRQSKDGVRAYFENLGSIWEMVFFDLEDMIGQNNRVVVLGNCKWKNRNTGKAVETKKVDVFRFKNGKILEFREYFDTAKAIAASTPDASQ